MRILRDPVLLVAFVVFAAACLWLGAPGFLDYDSAQFALAVGQHNMEFHHPQPPGFVFYVWLTQAVNLFVGDAYVSLRIVAIAFLLAAAAFLAKLAGEAFDRTTSRLAGVLFLATPIVVFHGLTTAIYPAEAFVCALAGWGAFRIQQGRRAALLGMALVLGMIGGLRQTAMGFAAPILLLATIRGRFPLRDWVLAFAAGTIGLLTWILPQLHFAGGLRHYVDANRLLQEFISSFSPFRMGLGGFRIQMQRGGSVLLFGFGIAKLAAVGLRWLRSRGARPAEADAEAPRHDRPLDRRFAMVWVVPSVAFVFLYHFPKSGYALAHWPILCLGVAWLLRRVSAPSPARGLLGWAVAFDLAVFFLVPTMHICCRMPWEISEAMTIEKSSITKQPWVPEAWYRPITWDEPSSEGSSPFGPRYSLARLVFGKVDFFFDRTRDFYFEGKVQALREFGLPRADTLVIGRQLTRILCYEMPEQLILHGDPLRPDYPFLLYRDRKAVPVGPTFEVPPEIRWILLDGRQDEMRFPLTDAGRLQPEPMPPPLWRRVLRIEIGDGPVDATYVAITIPGIPDKTIRLVRSPREDVAGAPPDPVGDRDRHP